MATYARKTETSVEASRMEIERTLTRYGADHFAYMNGPDKAVVAFQVAFQQRSLRVRFDMPMPRRDEKQFTEYRRGHGKIFQRTESAAFAEWQQACKQRWRALALVIKAKLEAVETGIATFEQEFLAYIVLPNGDRVGDTAIPAIEAAADGKPMPPLLGKF